jgi:hypothetical protein
MADTEAIVKIYGALDRAAQADPAARQRLAELLPQYRDPEFHWYDDFQKWLADTSGAKDASPAQPDPEKALQDLAKPATHPRMHARRMFAIALTARAFPKLRTHAEAALNELEPAEAIKRHKRAKDAKKRAKDLYDLLATDKAQVATPDIMVSGPAKPPSTDDWWKAVIGKASEEGTITSPTGMSPTPCAGRVLTVPGIGGSVAALETVHDTGPEHEDEIEFMLATRFIEPRNWHTCMPDFWCEMEAMPDPRLPHGQRRYREVVSTHCGEYGPGFWARTDLLFNFVWVPNKDKPVAAIANYELAPGRPLPHDRIVVDEGTLVVSKRDKSTNRLRIRTTKRIKFSYPFPSGALALIMCALGYADLSANLLACAAINGQPVAKALKAGKDPGVVLGVGHEFPGVAADVATVGAGGAGEYGPGSAAGLARDAVDWWARALRGGASAVERRGTYNKQGRPGG